MSVVSTTLAAGACSYILYQFVQMMMMGRRLKAQSYRLLTDSDFWRTLVPSWTDIPGVVSGNLQTLKVKHTVFDRAGMEAYTQVSWQSPNNPFIHLADLDAIKEITRPKAPFVQDVKTAEAIFGMYGSNILMLEGDEWKRHRRITQRAFSEENTRLVWSESVHAVKKLFEKWNAKEVQDVPVPQPNTITETLALMVISSAVLGQRMSWNEDPNIILPAGYSISFQRALTTVARTLITRVMTPSWAEGLSESTRHMAAGFREFGKYLRDIAVSYRDHGKLDHDLTRTETITTAPTDNLFKILMTANEEDKQDGIQGFTDEETAGNCFLFLLAGHETTAHALSFSLGLLAAYPDIQEEVYAQVKQTLDSRDHLEYHDYNELKLVTGTFFEALRMYPEVPRFSKFVEVDTVLTVARNGPNDDENSRETIALPVGSRAVISVAAVHYNSKYWPEPEEFRPSRFSGPYNRDAFLPFSTGRRACIGRKFAETEGTAIIATILAQYKIEIDHSKFQPIPGETLLARRERLLRPQYILSVAPANLPLVFKRRF